MPTFTHDDLALHYIDESAIGAANGEIIVLIHGFASNININWRNPLWLKTLTEAGYRVIALDNRGHGKSEAKYEVADYHMNKMVGDVEALLTHLNIAQAHMMGYSMGARIVAHFTSQHGARVKSLIIGGLGDRLMNGETLPQGIADAMRATSLDELTDPTERMFRAFADANKSDRRALAACIEGCRQALPEQQVRAITHPVLVAVGTTDEVSGDGAILAKAFPNGEYFPIEGRNHNLAVGDRTHQAKVLEFLIRVNNV